MATVNNAENKKALNILFVQNDEGSVLPTGTPVYIKGNSNGTILVGKADSNSVSKMPAVGITVSRVEINQDVDIVLGGFLEVPIAGLTAAQPGQNLYVAGGGGLTTVEPSGEVQSLGKILKTNAANTIALESLIAFGGASAGGGGGVSEFIALDDTPAAYDAANRGYLVAHNSSDDGVEFIDPATVGATTFTGLSDTPAAYTNGYDRPVSVTDVESGLQFSDYVYTSVAGDTVAFRTRRDESFSTAGDAEGLMVKPDYVLGGNVITSQLAHFWNGSGWTQMDNTSASTCTGMAAMGITASGQPLARALSQGFIKLASNPTGATAGGVLYFGTSGTLTGTAPTGSGEIVRVAGYAMDTNGFIYFNPSQDWLEIV